MTALDEEKFQQIIMNLVDNSCKYSSVGKTVSVRTSYANSDNILIQIKDEGVGISEEDISKIFDKFKPFFCFKFVGKYITTLSAYSTGNCFFIEI